MLQAFSRVALAALMVATLPLAARAQTNPAPFVPPVRPKTAVTHHTMQLNGRTLTYTATAGVTQLTDAKGDAAANMFSVAYTLDGASAASRPVTFIYNGGPGSSSMWLHMASFGPRRLVTTDAAHTPPAPYEIVDNEATLLDKSDLVFIDAVGTGFSRIVGHATGKDFYGVDEDARAFAQFIRRYVTTNERWNSPKFLLGESYGTTRSSVLVNLLQESGMAFTGVTLVSSALDFAALDPGAPGEDLTYISFLPTEAAVAWYHHRVPNRPASLEAFLGDVKRFVRTDYVQALAAGDALPAAQRHDIAAKMHGYLGIDARYIENAHLRVDPARFEKELLRDTGRTTGRLDGRFTGIDSDSAGETPEYDPTDAAIASAFIGSFNGYVRGELGYRVEDEYKGTNYGEVGANYNYKHAGSGGATNVIGDLRAALTKNPQLRLFSANGYYDLATPYYATDYALAHLGLDGSLAQNITYGYYESGHMIYLNPTARRAIKHDLDVFYDGAVRH